MRKNLWKGLICICGSLFFTSCSLMPEEDVLPASPVLYTYEANEYKLTAVMRGDMVNSKVISCTYVPAKEEWLSFSTGSLFIDKVYVDEGDQVKAGQVLAQLELGNLQEQISLQSYELKVLEMKKEHLLENQELDLRKHDIILGDLQWELDHVKGARVEYIKEKIEKQEELRTETAEDYAEQIQTAEDSIYLQKLRLEEAKENLKERQIIAGIDGTVTYVRGVTEGQRSVKDQSFVTISDLDTTVFQIKGKDALYFSEGQEVLILCQDKEFSAYVVDPAEMGYVKAKEEDPMVYLRLRQPDPTLQDGARGKIELILEQSENTLYVNKDVVKTTNGEAFVYMLDKDGMRIMQKVITGIENKEFIEIVEGLKENDSVILD